MSCTEKQLKEMSVKELLIEFSDIYYDFINTYKYTKESLIIGMDKIEKEIYLRTTS
jgi:hypothetical protein